MALDTRNKASASEPSGSGSSPSSSTSCSQALMTCHLATLARVAPWGRRCFQQLFCGLGAHLRCSAATSVVGWIVQWMGVGVRRGGGVLCHFGWHFVINALPIFWLLGSSTLCFKSRGFGQVFIM
jgi:hypothetical protein